MSTLTENLTRIYNTKLELKDVLETDSDIFEDYPDIAAAKIAQGGGSATPVDPWYNGVSILDMIDNEESSADYFYSTINDNFNITLDGNDAIEAVEWDDEVDVETGELDGEDNPIMETKTIHVIVNGDPHEIFGQAEAIDEALNEFGDDFGYLYGDIYPILENVTLTASEDPQTDGYDYLIEGDIHTWNLNDNCVPAQTISKNGFITNDGALGYYINVQANIGEAEFTTNGNYYAEDDGLDGWHHVNVDVPKPTIANKRAQITANGTYNAQSVDSVDGWSEVTVNVPTSASGTSYITSNGTYNISSYEYVNVNVPVPTELYKKVVTENEWDGWDIYDITNSNLLSLAILHTSSVINEEAPEYYSLKLQDTNGNTISTSNHPGYIMEPYDTHVEGDVCVLQNTYNSSLTCKVYLQHYILDNNDNQYVLDSETLFNGNSSFVTVNPNSYTSKITLELWNSGGSHNLIWHVYNNGQEVTFHTNS